MPPVSPLQVHPFLLSQNLCEFKPVSERYVLQLIKSLATKYNDLGDDITNAVLKECGEQLKIPVAKLINLSLRLGLTPPELKKAKVIAVHKSGSSTDMTNYRPISILPSLSKLLEKTVKEQLLEYLNENHLLASCQYGFRKKYGVQAALFDVVSQLQLSLDCGRMASALFIDLRKAFDTVNHEILLYKLGKINITGSVLNWIRDYLNGRSQFVCLDGFCSTTLNISCGVPQGSILGPLLFIIYLNDVAELKLNGKLVLFADDAAIFYEAENPEVLTKLMQEDVDTLDFYFLSNKLTWNIDKTALM